MKRFYAIPLVCLLCLATNLKAQTATIANDGWANNSVNAIIFRKNSLVTYQNIQYAAYYDSEQFVVLAKRRIGQTHWVISRTIYKGDATDAHKIISIMMDGSGILHVVWDEHTTSTRNTALNYARSVSPGSLQLGPKQSMTGDKEDKVTYPEFYKVPNGDLLFMYRYGASGNGDLMLNRYNLATKKWVRVQDGLIDGEGQRNAYCQTAIDTRGTIHLSWVWRETPNVATNHDMCYARSRDGGLTWEKSNGEKYHLPITAANAEYACKIPQNSELINQTSMFADDAGRPFIATYWREEGQTVPQYHLVYHDEEGWHTSNLGFLKTPFSLSGTGTKSIPLSRPQIIAWKKGGNLSAAIIFRAAERDDKASIAVSNNITKGNWKVSDIGNENLGAWEPTYDTELWKNKKVLDLFVQTVVQLDGEGSAHLPPSAVKVLEWKP